MIGGITSIALGAWFCPFGIGSRNGFQGLRRTITKAEVDVARVKDEELS